jgi:hypothetical protein
MVPLQDRNMVPLQHRNMVPRSAGKRQVISGERNGRRRIGGTTPGAKDSLMLRAKKRGVNSAPMKIGISEKVTQKRRRKTTQRIVATLNVESAL